MKRMIITAAAFLSTCALSDSAKDLPGFTLFELGTYTTATCKKLQDGKYECRGVNVEAEEIVFNLDVFRKGDKIIAKRGKMGNPPVCLYTGTIKEGVIEGDFKCTGMKSKSAWQAHLD